MLSPKALLLLQKTQNTLGIILRNPTYQILNQFILVTIKIIGLIGHLPVTNYWLLVLIQNMEFTS